MAAAEEIRVTLPAEAMGSVRRAVAAGEYATDADAIRDAVREWQERRNLAGYTVAELRAAVAEADAGGPGRYGSMDAIKAEARRRMGG